MADKRVHVATHQVEEVANTGDRLSRMLTRYIRGNIQGKIPNTVPGTHQVKEVADERVDVEWPLV